MIGNETYANVIADIQLAHDSFDAITDEWIAPLPKGWKHIGTGGFRSCFLGPDGVVYKREWGVSCEMNENESFLYSEQGNSDEMPEGVRLAACTLYGTVLAMEYVKDDGSVPMKWENLIQFTRTNCLADCAFPMKRRMNWHSVQGVIVLTDYSL
jgi:hypothetical protein